MFINFGNFFSNFTWCIANNELVEKGIRSSRYAPYNLGYAHGTMASTIRHFQLCEDKS